MGSEMKWCISLVRQAANIPHSSDQGDNSLCFSISGPSPGDSDSLVLHLRGGARGAVSHPG